MGVLIDKCNFFRQVVAIVLIQFGRQRGVRSTGVLFIYWLLQSVAAVLALQTHARTVAAGVIIMSVIIMTVHQL